MNIFEDNNIDFVIAELRSYAMSINDYEEDDNSYSLKLEDHADWLEANWKGKCHSGLNNHPQSNAWGVDCFGTQIKPSLKGMRRVDCEGVGDNDGFYEIGG